MDFYKDGIEKTTASQRSFPLMATLDDSHLDLTVREILLQLINSQQCDAISVHHLEFSTVKFVENTHWSMQ